MGSFSLTSHLCFPKHSYLCTTTPNPPYIILPIKVTSLLKHPKHLSPSSQNLMITKQKQSPIRKSLILETEDGNTFLLSRGSVILGAVSIGLVLLLLGVDDHNKALAMGPEGPLVEEFWDNMRRYGLYILTVSTGVAYTILEPILELLRNPITAILIVVIFAGSFYIVSQVLSAMVGVSEFNYQYGY